MVENTCTLLHNCKGYCCNDVAISMSEEDFKTWSDFEPGPEWLTPQNLCMVEAIMDIAPNDGIFFTQKAPGRFHVAIVGNCPHLSNEDNCTIYEYRPNACRKAQRGGPLCTEKRIEYGLQPIYLEKSVFSTNS